eukprot:CFRG6345T1
MRSESLPTYTDTYDYLEDPTPECITKIELFCDDVQNGTSVTFNEVLSNVNREDQGIKMYCDLLIHDVIDGGSRSVEVQQHGGATRKAKLKSFLFTFQQWERPWRGLSVLVVKKESSDKSGIRSKILFDTFKAVPHFNGLRTNFMSLQVHIKLKTGEVQTVDYGFYTNFESVDENFVRRRHLEGVKKFWLYKFKSWDFAATPAIRMKSDPDYNEVAFAGLMESAGSDDNTRLVQMMHDINNCTDKEFPMVLQQWFDLDNLATWVAVTLAILGDWDHTGNNMALFSNDILKRFYFQPWDYDKSLRTCIRHSRLDVSMSVLADHYLFRRIMSTMPVKFMGKVNEKVELLTGPGAPFSPSSMKLKADLYAEAVRPFTVKNMPDARLVKRVPWEEHKDDFFKLLHNNKIYWNSNHQFPLSVGHIHAKQSQICYELEQCYSAVFKPSISPTGLDVEHQIVIHHDFDPVATHWYSSPDFILWRSEWRSFGRSDLQRKYELIPQHLPGQVIFPLYIPDSIIDYCRYETCFLNVHARDTEGGVGNYAARNAPLFKRNNGSFVVPERRFHNQSIINT